MQRYKSMPPVDLRYPYPDDLGEWVRYADAEAEIEKARRQGAIEQEAKCEAVTETIRADEQGRIASVLRQWIHDNSHKPDWIEGLSDALKIVLHQDADYRKEPWYRPVQEPKPLEKLPDEASRHDQRRLLNELVDAVQGIQKWIVRHDT